MTAKQRILLFPILLFSSACAPKLSAGELEEAGLLDHFSAAYDTEHIPGL